MQIASMCESVWVSYWIRRSQINVRESSCLLQFSLLRHARIPQGGGTGTLQLTFNTLLRGTGMHSLHFGWLLQLLNRSKMPECCGAKMYVKVHTYFFFEYAWLANLCGAVSFPCTNRCRTHREPFVTLMIVLAMCLYPVHLTHGVRLHAGEKKKKLEQTRRQK